MKTFLYFFVIMGLCSCQFNSDPTLFRKIDYRESGIDFTNTITENDTFNVLDYEYIYNGSGVGVGDFDKNGLPDLFFAGNMVSSRLYLNQGKLRFEDITEQAGVATDAWCTGIAVVDINNDGWEDIHVSTAHDAQLNGSKNYFFIHQGLKNGIPIFKNLATEMGLNESLYSIQVAFLDYDKDEDLDLFLINNSMENYPRNRPIGQSKDGSGKSVDRLYRNDGLDANGLPKFTNVSEEAAILVEGWSLGIAVVDINEDDYPDLYIANDFLSNDLLYVNQKDGTFSNEIANYFKHQSYNSMGIDVADVNNDALDDLLVLDMLPEDNLRRKTMFAQVPFDRFDAAIQKGYQPQFVRNVLQINNGNGVFSDWGYYSGLAATDWSWTPLLADFDNDGWRDVYITNGYKKDVTDLDFINYSGEFNVFGTREEKRAKLIEQLKKIEGIKKTNRLFLNQKELRFEDQTAASGLEQPSYSNGAVYADLDADGDLDIVVNNLNDPALLFENRSENNYLTIKLPNDETAYGTSVQIYTKLEKQTATFYPQRGYLSSVEPKIHFGLGKTETVDSIQVVFPNGRRYVAHNITTNQTLKLHQNMANHTRKRVLPNAVSTPVQVLNDPPIEYRPIPSRFDDFKKWSLHFRSYSRTGAVLARADVNGDGLEDVFIGGSNQQAQKLFLQTTKGFQERPFPTNENQPYNDVAAVFFDADGDQDMDLYCVRGSSAHYGQPESYQDRYFENDGTGKFTLRSDRLPTISAAGSCAIPFDYDADGDLDLFVGGRLDAAHYPKSPRSFLLQNENGQFIDVTPKTLAHLGMVTDAVAVQMNEDNLPDLVVVGEWMPVQIFYNEDGQFKHATTLPHSSGWWNCIAKADMDKDGDDDLLIGNWGLNNPFHANPEQPLALHAKDYDDNGAVEAIMTYYNQGKSYIFHPRETLAKQLPGIKNLFNDYRSYGEAVAKTVLDINPNTDVQRLQAVELASVYIENTNTDELIISKLPYQVQAAPIFDWATLDVNQDGHLDVLGVGNYHGVEILSGQYDALNGITLLGDGKSGFTYLSAAESGFDVPTEANVVLPLSTVEGSTLLLVGSRVEALKWFEH
ncbi:MAG: VCBS repeat-containing protein [Bacteroidota bacterium]